MAHDGDSGSDYDITYHYDYMTADVNKAGTKRKQTKVILDDDEDRRKRTRRTVIVIDDDSDDDSYVQEEEEENDDSSNEDDAESINSDDDSFVASDSSDDEEETHSGAMFNAPDLDAVEDIEDDESAHESRESIRKKVRSAISKDGITNMHESLNFAAFEQQIWATSYASMMNSQFYTRYLNWTLHKVVKNLGNGSSRSVAAFHRSFIRVMEGGDGHMEEVQITRQNNVWPYKGTCSCCNAPRMLTHFWVVTMGNERIQWQFGCVCAEALEKVAEVYNAFRWLERPDDGYTNRGFAFLTNPFGTIDFGRRASHDTKTRALAKFRAVLCNLATDSPFRAMKK
jgi:hypothetical protein